MIWIAGKIVADDELKISALDRAFEHGIGLFETLRNWNGKATLLSRHLDRMARSAKTLGLRLDPATLPDEAAVADLLRSEQREGDAMLRITLGGGRSGDFDSPLWMRCAELPPAMPASGAVLAVTPWAVESNHPLARHKTLNYWDRRLAYEFARGQGADEALMMTSDGGYREGSRTNLFTITGDTLSTPALTAPIVPGIMRQLVIELARGIGLDVNEPPFLHDAVLGQAAEVFLTNSVRGIISVAAVGERRWHAPGSRTRLLTAKLADWLEPRGPTPR